MRQSSNPLFGKKDLFLSMKMVQPTRENGLVISEMAMDLTNNQMGTCMSVVGKRINKREKDN
jgi:hypothetical protein